MCNTPKEGYLPTHSMFQVIMEPTSGCRISFMNTAEVMATLTAVGVNPVSPRGLIWPLYKKSAEQLRPTVLFHRPPLCLMKTENITLLSLALWNLWIKGTEIGFYLALHGCRVRVLPLIYKEIGIIFFSGDKCRVCPCPFWTGRRVWGLNPSFTEILISYSYLKRSI